LRSSHFFLGVWYQIHGKVQNTCLISYTYMFKILCTLVIKFHQNIMNLKWFTQFFLITPCNLRCNNFKHRGENRKKKN
jgi:hypothetical protein